MLSQRRTLLSCALAASVVLTFPVARADDRQFFGFVICGAASSKVPSPKKATPAEPTATFVLNSLSPGSNYDALLGVGLRKSLVQRARVLGFPDYIAVGSERSLSQYDKSSIGGNGAFVFHAGSSIADPIVGFQFANVPLAVNTFVVSYCASDNFKIIDANGDYSQEELSTIIQQALPTFSGKSSVDLLWNYDLYTLSEPQSLESALAVWMPAPAAPPPVIPSPTTEVGDVLPTK